MDPKSKPKDKSKRVSKSKPKFMDEDYIPSVDFGDDEDYDIEDYCSSEW